jgi:hypothetical protein
MPISIENGVIDEKRMLCYDNENEFLCYARILEIPFKTGKEKGIWIDHQILNLKDDLAVFICDRKVRMLGKKSLGMWLKEDGRDALSHANIQSNQLVRYPKNV